MNRIEDVFSITRRGCKLAALFAVMLALAGFANTGAMASMNSHKAKKGSLKIIAPTEVGGVTLQPGDYEVKEINSQDGAVVEFVHLFDNLYAAEGLPVHEQEVVARVKSTEQALNTPPKHTQLRFAPNTTNAIALEIRGSAVDYLFQPSELTFDTNTGANPTVACTNVGLQE